MTHDEMVQGIANGIRQGKILAVVRNKELRLFTNKHVGEHLTEAEARTAISAEEYVRLSEADRSAQWN